jgi:hypothetical protein
LSLGPYNSVRFARSRTGRNGPYPCGSGKKYKKCCLKQRVSTLADQRSFSGVLGAEHPPLLHYITSPKAFCMQHIRPYLGLVRPTPSGIARINSRFLWNSPLSYAYTMPRKNSRSR